MRFEKPKKTSANGRNLGRVCQIKGPCLLLRAPHHAQPSSWRTGLHYDVGGVLAVAVDPKGGVHLTMVYSGGLYEQPS
jgi:hypothetical protein